MTPEDEAYMEAELKADIADWYRTRLPELRTLRVEADRG